MGMRFLVNEVSVGWLARSTRACARPHYSTSNPALGMRATGVDLLLCEKKTAVSTA